jgi:predicted GNAT family N-acyltransferase
LLSGYPQELLEKQLGEFSCTRDSDIESFIRTRAIDYEVAGLGRTYLYLEGSAENTRLVAYITIAITSVDYTEVSRNRRKKVLHSKPGRDSQNNFPGLLIAQLARDDSFDGSVIDGTKLIADAESLIEIGRQALGGMLIYLDCKEHMVKFYQRHGYELITSDEPLHGLYKMFKLLPKLPVKRLFCD